MSDVNESKCWYYFTFGVGQQFAGKYVKFFGTYFEAREKMFERFGADWAFQYDEKRWDEITNKPDRWWPMEEELVLE